ncbi:MAG: HIT family protein [Thaumarchaeota archaeon]|jgi:histidine triad (HIT) family protein|nr:HIT family protein [Nitrososphaerota archaeon]
MPFRVDLSKVYNNLHPVQECPFCQISAHQDKAVVVFEDSNYLAFMDKRPINTGHTLVIPRKHYVNVMEMPREEVGQTFSLAAVISRAVVQATNADGINLGQNNGSAASQEVPHLHVHIIPRFIKEVKEGFWPRRKVTSLSELQNVGERIRSELSKILLTRNSHSEKIIH